MRKQRTHVTNLTPRLPLKSMSPGWQWCNKHVASQFKFSRETIRRRAWHTQYVYIAHANQRCENKQTRGGSINSFGPNCDPSCSQRPVYTNLLPARCVLIFKGPAAVRRREIPGTSPHARSADCYFAQNKGARARAGSIERNYCVPGRAAERRPSFSARIGGCKKWSRPL